jgi:ABC-type dipeptide/oligopeptide/nickel transport system ATPase component
MDKILEIKNLSVQFTHGQQIIKAVDGVSLDIVEGEILALVGESGSGKTLTALSIVRILPEGSRIAGGEIIFRNQDLLRVNEKEIEAIRGKDIAYIFQEAAASLNPVLTIGCQIAESIILHQHKNKKEALTAALELVWLAHLPRPEHILKSYPHQLSGGMNQRVMIAMALSCRPKLLIADEPTTALDVTIEKEIIRVLLELKEKLNYSILFITHNLALIEKFAHRIAIMYQGKVVEEGNTKDIFSYPKHAHTRDLVGAIIR